MIPYSHESIRLTGRWDTTSPDAAVTTTTGAYLEFAFEGRMALVLFDTLLNATPLLHLWVQLDGGDMIETPIDSHIRILAKNEGKHICRVIYKGGSEKDRRWYAPLTGKVSFVGAQAEKPLPIEEDTRPIIEFVGDSITEGVLMPLGALLMSLLLGWKFPNLVKDECEASGHKFRGEAYTKFAFRFLIPIVMAIVLYTQIQAFFL